MPLLIIPHGQFIPPYSSCFLLHLQNQPIDHFSNLFDLLNLFLFAHLLVASSSFLLMAFNNHISPILSRMQVFLLLYPTWLIYSPTLQLRALLSFSYNPLGGFMSLAHLATIFIEHHTLVFPHLPIVYRHKLGYDTTLCIPPP
jgi:hypothetical protein